MPKLFWQGIIFYSLQKSIGLNICGNTDFLHFKIEQSGYFLGKHFP